MMMLIDEMMMLLMVEVMMEWSDFIGMMSIVQDLEVNNRQLLSNTERMRTELDRVVQVTLTEKIWSASFLLPSIIVLLGEAPLEQLDLICHLS